MAGTTHTDPTHPERPPRPRVSGGEGGWGGEGRLLPIAYAVALVVAVFRRPDFLFHAQFWAEDGPVWFQQAHALGPLGALPLTYNGYYHLFPRLAGAAGALVGARLAPLVMNGLSVLAYAAPVPLALLLARTRRERWFLAGCGALYLLLPYSRETHFSATNAIWPLALCLLLLALRALERPDAAGRRGALLAGLALCGLSGPFALFLLPALGLALGPRLARPPRPAAPGAPARAVPWAALAVLGACAAVQLAALAGGTRVTAAAGGAPPIAVLARIIGGQVVAGGLLGEAAVRWLYDHDAVVVYAALAALYLYAVARGAWLGDARLRAFVVYAQAILAAALLAPSASGDVLAQLMAPLNGQRYWLLPTLCFLVCAACIAATSRVAAERVALAALLPLFLVGAARDFALAPLPDLRYEAHVAAYCALPPGEAMAIPINPEGWRVDLVRRAGAGCR